MTTEAEVRAAARSLAVTVVSGSKDTSPDQPRPGDGEPRWKNWEHSARAALEAAEIERATNDKLMRCTICGFTVDTSYAAEKPTCDFTTRGRGKT